ncbi:hypothetical protein [Sporosalibacterium faouarense]|uniref:hypothetical protein n=1 Tax=Sporosalibacterium faouarense TaxID=516123 RepID=UPI00192C0DD4|nr:hypothetical protein [Sporosalibacterium faouarense]
MKEVNLNNKEEIKNFFNNLNSIKLKRNYQDELLYKLGQWVSYPEANSNITYTIFINTVNKYI